MTDEIIKIREKLRFYNLSKLAKKLGVSRELLSRFVRGKTDRLSAVMYIKLNNFFDSQEVK